SLIRMCAHVCGAWALALSAHSTRLPGRVAGRARFLREDEALRRLSREPGRNVPRPSLSPPMEPGRVCGIGRRHDLGLRRAPRRTRLLWAPPGDPLVWGLPRPRRFL